MTEQRVAILDASHSLFKPSPVRIDGLAGVPSEPTSSSTISASTSSTSTSSSNKNGSPKRSGINDLLLQPIPDFPTITKEAVAEACLEGSVGAKAPVDVKVGVICEASAVGVIAQALHSRVVEKLKAATS